MNVYRCSAFYHCKRWNDWSGEGHMFSSVNVMTTKGMYPSLNQLWRNLGSKLWLSNEKNEAYCTAVASAKSATSQVHIFCHHIHSCEESMVNRVVYMYILYMFYDVISYSSIPLKYLITLNSPGKNRCHPVLGWTCHWKNSCHLVFGSFFMRR